ncbi:MAG TPA: ABC transporter permease [Sphingobacteriaceae bacterium]
MIRNYFLLAFRNLKKQKTFTFINIAGLTVGITCCLMIFLFVQNEFSFDRFHKNNRDIYRVMRAGDGRGQPVPYLSPPYATALQNDYPDAIRKAVRVLPTNGLVSYGNVAFTEKKVYLADAGFFELFDFKLLQGSRADALKDPGNVVLTRSTARKYFGGEDPMGKIITMDKQYQLKVTGIAEDVPANSTLNFDVVMPLSNFSAEPWFSVWNNNNLFTYVQLAPGTDQQALNASFPGFMRKYLPASIPDRDKSTLVLSPLTGIYFEEAGPWDNVRHGNRSVVYIFISIGALILFIACINFMNLATARATERAREVGLRKVLGALRKQLVVQFMGESFLLAIISCLLAMILLQLLMPAYQSLLGYSLPAYWSNPFLYVFVAVVILVVGVLAGSYPALLLSSFSPIESLRGKLKLGRGGAWFRKALVIFQFSSTVLLIIGMLIIGSQMDYVRGKDLGFDKEQSVVVQLDNGEIWSGRQRFKQLLENQPGIKMVSLMSGVPGGFHDNFMFQVEGQVTQPQFRTAFADFGYLKTLGIRLIAGRDFSASFPTDSAHSVIINREAAAAAGWTPRQALGKRIRNLTRDSVPRTVIGVVENYHFLSLKEKMQPIVIAGNDDRRVAVIKLEAGKIQSGLASVRKIYSQIAPVYPFEYVFLDQQFNEHYQTDLRQQKILGGFSAVAIFIACLGLFGLSSYTAVRRTKEIGVRKVLGSSIRSIVILLSRDLLKPVLTGTVIAIPLGYLAMSRWLENFAYRTTLHWWVFGGAALIAILIAMVTVGYQALRAASANPVKSLRTE